MDEPNNILFTSNNTVGTYATGGATAMPNEHKRGNGEERREKRSILIFLTSLFSFLETLPGIITAVVALIAAIAGIFRVTQGHFPFTPSPSRPPPAVTAITPSATQTGGPHGTPSNLPLAPRQQTQNGKGPQP